MQLPIAAQTTHTHTNPCKAFNETNFVLTTGIKLLAERKIKGSISTQLVEDTLGKLISDQLCFDVCMNSTTYE